MPWDDEKELNVDEFDTEQEEVEFADLAALAAAENEEADDDEAFFQVPMLGASNE